LLLFSATTTTTAADTLQSTKLTEKEKKRAKAYPVRKFALKA
jgi:hypothetical protein